MVCALVWVTMRVWWLSMLGCFESLECAVPSLRRSIPILIVST